MTYIDYLFTIDWTKENANRSTNDVVGRYCKENNIDYHYSHYFDLVADFFGTGDYYKIETTNDGYKTHVFADTSMIYA